MLLSVPGMSSGINELTDALKASSIAHPVDNESKTIALLATYIEQNKSDESRCELLISLLELIEDDVNNDRKVALFQESSLTLIPLLTPLTRSERVRPSVSRVLLLSSEFAWPREAVLALGEVLEGLEDQLETFDVSDDGEGFEDDDELDEGLVPGIITELSLLLEAYSLVIPRLPKKRSTPTILRLSNALESLLSGMSDKTTEESSRELLEKLARLIKACWDWSNDCEDVGGEQQSLLRHILFVAITLLGPMVGAGLLERWFLRTFPRYATTSPSSSDPSDQGLAALKQAVIAAEHIGVNNETLVQTLIHPTSITPHASLASLLLLATGVSGSSDKHYASLPRADVMNLLQDSMPVLSAALGGSAVDAGAVWAWQLLNGANDTMMDHGAASMLLEILVPLTAMHPSPLSRLAFFKLLSRVCSCVTSPEDEIALLRQLVEPENPFDEIRLAGVTIAREKLSAAGNQKLLVPDLILHLGPCCFQLPPGPEPTLELAMEDLLQSPWPSWFTECLSLFWVLYVNDTQNLSSVRDLRYVAALRQMWLEPQQARLQALQSELQSSIQSQSQAEVAFTIERWSQALQRVADIAAGDGLSAQSE